MRKLFVMSTVIGVLEFIAVLVIYYIRFHRLPFASWAAALITGIVGGVIVFLLLRIAVKGPK